MPEDCGLAGLSMAISLTTGDDPIPLASAVNLDSVESVAVAVLTNVLVG